MKTPVLITAAVSLTSKQRETLEKAVQKKFGSQLEFSEVIDPSVLGGLKVRVGTWEYDATMQTRLAKVRQQLLAQA